MLLFTIKKTDGFQAYVCGLGFFQFRPRNHHHINNLRLEVAKVKRNGKKNSACNTERKFLLEKKKKLLNKATMSTKIHLTLIRKGW